MKILLRILVVLVLFILVAAVGLVYFIRNADYKSTIEEAVAEATGYNMTIAGDLDLEFFPVLGITLNDVRLSNPGIRQELMSTSRAVLRVDFRELINGNLLVQELIASDFHVNYYVHEDGTSIWDTPQSSAAVSGSDSGGDSSDIAALTFDRISITNTSIDYQDFAAGTRYEVANFNLESQDTNLAGRPFDIQIDFDFENNGMSAPVPISLRSNVLVDLNNGNLNFNNVALSVTPLLLQGEISVANFDSNMQFSGNLGADAFDVRGLLQTFAMVPEAEELTLPGVSNQQMASFQVQFSGNENEATIPDLVLTLGDASIEGNGSIRFAGDRGPSNVSYSIIGGDIDLTPYLAGDTEEVVDQSDATADTPLPLDTLRSMNLLGSISLASITVNDMRFDDINLYTNIEDGVLDLELTPVSAFDGSVAGSIRLDASTSSGSLTSHVSARQINLVQLAPSISRFNSVTGNLNLEADHTASGNTVNGLLGSLNGTTSFNVTDNSVDIGLIKQVFTAIAALSPTGGTIQQWPDVIQFSEMGGYLVLQDGLAANQELKLRMDNFDITGTGGLDLNAGSFDYDLLFTVLGEGFTQTIPINELYHDISWPVQCQAAFADPLSQYCGPDFAQVRQIFAQIGTNTVRSRLDEVISDQVPDNVQDSARSLLRNLFDR